MSTAHTAGDAPGMGIPGSPDLPDAGPGAETTFDPLRLCIFATVALLGWALGPFALVWFAGLGFVGYWKARQAGLTRSRCLLRDTRLVLAYLGVLVAAGLVGAGMLMRGWLT